MDIITHTFSGIAVATVVAGFSKGGIKQRLGLFCTGALGGALPDIDAISLWSRFDDSIGRLFGLSYSGREIYTSKLWYAHHAFFHSVFAGLLIALITAMLVFLVKNKFKKINRKNFIGSLKWQGIFLISFMLAYLLHLVEDMPTPSSVWGGVRLFFPFKAYIGGSGDIWWWNNYDIFLIALLVILLNSIVLVFRSQSKKRIGFISLAVFLFGLSVATIQIKNRPLEFKYTGHTPNYNQHESVSKEIQKEILGIKLYRVMEDIDNKLPIYF